MAGRRQGKSVRAKLAACSDRNAAEDLVGALIEVPRSALPATRPGEYYWTDLEGLQVFTGTEPGPGPHVTHLLETGANDVLVVDGDRERLIPYLPEQVVLDVDLARVASRWTGTRLLRNRGCDSTSSRLFPEMFDAIRLGVTGRALQRGRVSLKLWNPRDFTQDAAPHGGSTGLMVAARAW